MSAPESAYPDLSGQVALVTGGGRGLGRTFSLALAAAGAAVAVVARSKTEIAETVALIEAAGGRAQDFSVDVSDRAGVEQTVAAVTRDLGPVDLLINNAGVLPPAGPVWDTDPEAWWRNQEVNLRGPLLFIHAVVPDMIARQRGRIVNVASGAGITAMPNASAYGVSKAALIRLTEMLALEARPYGVSAFAITPGTVRTPMTEETLSSPELAKWMPWLTATLEEGRDFPAERAVELLMLLASGEADVLTGRFLSIRDDLEMLLEHAEEVKARELYTLRLNQLE
ncbi:MAG: SDR family oxidoreductase [Trueperaceae bacterium]|nr:MAG: SDR family oxidoreductase [Trueperaceae bacterium]